MSDDGSGHVPVLPVVVREFLTPREGDVVLDATVGSGGHAHLFADAIGPTGTLIGLDVDPRCLKLAGARLAECTCRVELIHANFRQARESLASVGVDRVNVLLADLGVSSSQLDDAKRGLSFQRAGPLDMRLDPRLSVTAAELVNRLKERELADLLYYNAQEMGSRRVAKRICEARRQRRITTTEQLESIVFSALGGSGGGSRRGKIHPATRTFQALRMAVNDEIGCLDALLAGAPDLLAPGGRIGVIAFHSGEDKPVKVDFRKRKREGAYRIVTAKPVIADQDERRRNPRARSAKLRVAIRLPEPPSGE